MPEPFIALLRAVNVGGGGKLPTKTFVQILNDLKLQSVSTYIQTGNAVFLGAKKDKAKQPARIAAAIDDACGFKPDVIVLTLDEIAQIIESNTIAAPDLNASRLFVHFLTSKPAKPDLAKLDSLLLPSEQYALTDKALYFYAPDGVAPSKAYGRIEKLLGVTATARNWRTTCKLRDMAKAIA